MDSKRQPDGIPVLTDDCPHRLALMTARALAAEKKARMWDRFMMVAHRMRSNCKEVYDRIMEEFR